MRFLPVCSLAVALAVCASATRVLAQEGNTGTVSGLSPSSYPESPDGLRDLVENIFGAIRSGDTAKTSAYCSNLLISDHMAWFAKVFNPTEGPPAGSEIPRNVGGGSRPLQENLRNHSFSWENESQDHRIAETRRSGPKSGSSSCGSDGNTDAPLLRGGQERRPERSVPNIGHRLLRIRGQWIPVSTYGSTRCCQHCTPASYSYRGKRIGLECHLQSRSSLSRCSENRANQR